jgi:hypothetical protein
VTSCQGQIAFRGALDVLIPSITMTGNTLTNYLTQSTDSLRIESAILVTQVKTLTFNTNEVANVQAKNTAGLGHAIQTWTLSESWTFNAKNNKIHDNAGGILIVTNFMGKDTNFNGKNFFVPTSTIDYNNFYKNTYFALAVADITYGNAYALMDGTTHQI